MQSALDIFCYVLVLIYGLALSADLSTGGYVSRQQKYLLTLLCLLFLLCAPDNRSINAGGGGLVFEALCHCASSLSYMPISSRKAA